MEQTADSLENLQRTMAQGEENRASSQQDFAQLNEKLNTLVETMRTEQSLMMKLAEGQQGLKEALTGAGGADQDETRYLKNMDQNLSRLIDESTRGQAETVQELRSEIRILARTIAAQMDSNNG